MLANKPRFRPWPRRPRPQKGSGPRFILHFFMCFIVARCPGRSVLKAVRRLKPEKPTKRLLTRRWRTIRISKGQLSLPYLTLPAKEIRLGPAIPPLAISSFYFFFFFPFILDNFPLSNRYFYWKIYRAFLLSPTRVSEQFGKKILDRTQVSETLGIARDFSYISSQCDDIFYIDKPQYLVKSSQTLLRRKVNCF